GTASLNPARHEPAALDRRGRPFTSPGENHDRNRRAGPRRARLLLGVTHRDPRPARTTARRGSPGRVVVRRAPRRSVTARRPARNPGSGGRDCRRPRRRTGRGEPRGPWAALAVPAQTAGRRPGTLGPGASHARAGTGRPRPRGRGRNTGRRPPPPLQGPYTQARPAVRTATFRGTLRLPRAGLYSRSARRSFRARTRTVGGLAPLPPAEGLPRAHAPGGADRATTPGARRRRRPARARRVARLVEL